MNQQKNRLLGMAAHDLRNPLGVISTYAEFLETDAAAVLNEEQREFVTTIKDTSEFMLRLVTDLLYVSAIEAGQLNLDRQTADLARHLVTIEPWHSNIQQHDLRPEFPQDIQRGQAGDCLNAADARGHAALGENPKGADVAGARDVRPAA